MAESVFGLLQTVIFLIPVAAIIWKASALSSTVENLETKVDYNISKFCSDHKDMSARIEEERKQKDETIMTIMKTLNEIQQSIVRIETKIGSSK